MAEARATLDRLTERQGRAILTALDEYVSDIGRQIVALSPTTQAQQRAALSATRAILVKATNRLHYTLNNNMLDGRETAFSEIWDIWQEAQRSVAKLAGVSGNLLGAIRPPPLAQLAAFERLNLPSNTWKTALLDHVRATGADLDRIIRNGIARGVSVDVLAKGLRPYVVGSQSFRDAFGADADAVLKDLRKIPANNPALREAGRKVRYNAQRIAYTELNNARAMAELAHYASDPLIDGILWRTARDRGKLKPPDVCDVLRDSDFYGRGPGWYPLTAIPPVPHPFDRCEREPTMRPLKEANKPKPKPPLHEHPEQFMRGTAGMTSAQAERTRELALDLIRAPKLAETAFDAFNDDALKLGERWVGIAQSHVQRVMPDLVTPKPVPVKPPEPKPLTKTDTAAIQSLFKYGGKGGSGVINMKLANFGTLDSAKDRAVVERVDKLLAKQPANLPEQRLVIMGDDSLEQQMQHASSALKPSVGTSFDYQGFLTGRDIPFSDKAVPAYQSRIFVVDFAEGTRRITYPIHDSVLDESQILMERDLKLTVTSVATDTVQYYGQTKQRTIVFLKAEPLPVKHELVFKVIRADLDPARRDAILKVEDEIRHKPYEYASEIAPDGERLYLRTDKHHNQVSMGALPHRNNVFTHTHPVYSKVIPGVKHRADETVRYWSGSLSEGDWLALQDLAEMRATDANGGFYSIIRPEGGWPTDAKIRAARKKWSNSSGLSEEASKIVRKLYPNAYGDEYRALFNQAWSHLVNVHMAKDLGVEYYASNPYGRPAYIP